MASESQKPMEFDKISAFSYSLPPIKSHSPFQTFL